jgi:hypothetical protein
VTTLEIPAEPAELRAGTLARVEADPGKGRALVAEGAWIAGYLWEAWGRELARAGLDPDRFRAIVAGYDRELWLWLFGERTWAQCADGLAGRVRRRLP